MSTIASAEINAVVLVTQLWSDITERSSKAETDASSGA